MTANERTPDGRRERSRSSRARIVAAMLDLVRQGDVQPSAARVADAAGVGLRTVFRHFTDMDLLYREMSQAIEAQVLPVALRPLVSHGWRDQVRELARRRIDIFELILPYRISASLKRYQSAFLMHDYQRMLALERSAVELLLPPSLLADPVRSNALQVALSFQCWRLLRHDQQLPLDAARAVMLHLVDAVLARAGDA